MPQATDPTSPSPTLSTSVTQLLESTPVGRLFLQKTMVGAALSSNTAAAATGSVVKPALPRK